MKIFKWCIKNDIRVYREPTRLGKKPPVILVLDYKGQIKKGSEVFSQGTQQLEQKIAEVYEWAYDRALNALQRQQQIKRDNST
jgi:hypothetical protein